MTPDMQAPEGALDAGLSPALRRTGSATQLTPGFAQTSWTEAGEAGVIGFGQKTWMTDAGDVAMLDVATLTLGTGHG
ncbi:type VI secretion system accessory protein TagJ [Cupriavidus basilensis]|uniref:type VI secretion system accessory protein TagJ n=1 Tax=Cupriavidus basilensis TaxID=68895 RepID=UPI0020C6CAE8|nr:type VI secretion system accessory protein TagJ [Cupriavidus basilensis]